MEKSFEIVTLKFCSTKLESWEIKNLQDNRFREIFGDFFNCDGFIIINNHKFNSLRSLRLRVCFEHRENFFFEN